MIHPSATAATTGGVESVLFGVFVAGAAPAASAAVTVLVTGPRRSRHVVGGTARLRDCVSYSS